jgi:hypothetical protein
MIPVVIPYYKAWRKLNRCMKHLRAQSISEELEIHIEDDSKLSSGYTAVVNRGIRRFLALPTDWDYLVILDQDMYLDPDAIERLRECLSSQPNCGIAVAVQRHIDSPMFIHGAGRDCIPVGSAEVSHWTFRRDNKPAFWQDIACCMVRKECLWDIGLLDENFVFVCSDSDWGFTARSKGWQVWSCGFARGIHQRGHSAADSIKAKKEMKKERPRELSIQMAKDAQLFRAKWEKSDYYQLLKYNGPKTPIRVIKAGEICELDEKGDTMDKGKEESKCG